MARFFIYKKNVFKYLENKKYYLMMTGWDKLENKDRRYIESEFDNDKLIKENHAPKADELNFTKASDYGYVLGLYDKVKSKKNIDDEVQEKFLRLEMLENAMGLVQNEQENVN